MGHEFVGVVDQVRDAVQNVKVGDCVVGSFFASDNTCEICQAGYQSRYLCNVVMGPSALRPAAPAANKGFWESTSISSSSRPGTSPSSAVMPAATPAVRQRRAS